ncbi:MAG: endonuclease III [Ardenticatenia bacterium]|nr:endonuclease III [Ardenticatenia bacterium]
MSDEATSRARDSHVPKHVPAEVWEHLPDLRQKASEIYHRLLQTYGEPDWRPRYPPLEELIITTLAQNSTDHNALMAYRRLRERFPSWEAIMNAPVEAVIDAVRPAGLTTQKGPRIQAILRKVWEEQGAFDLGFLGELPTEEAEAWLTSIKGVGHKTASIVLLFCFHRPTFPVDTHVSRVSRRLGIVPERATTRQIRAVWEMIVPPEWYYSLHLNLIRHGRHVCKARRPRCDHCVLQDLCDFYRNKSDHRPSP